MSLSFLAKIISIYKSDGVSMTSRMTDARRNRKLPLRLMSRVEISCKKTCFGAFRHLVYKMYHPKNKTRKTKQDIEKGHIRRY